MKGKGEKMKMKDFMGKRGEERRLVLEEGKGENGVCSSILALKSAEFLSVK